MTGRERAKSLLQAAAETRGNVSVAQELVARAQVYVLIDIADALSEIETQVTLIALEKRHEG